MSDIERIPGGIRVRSESDGGITVVHTPQGFSDLAFRTAVAGIYTYFMNNGRLPTVDEMFKAWPDLPKKTYAGLFLTEELREALAYRGVAWDSEVGLSLEQQSVLQLLSDPTDRRMLGAKLKQLRVPMPRYQAWLKQPLFAEYLNKQTKAAFVDFLPSIRTVLIGNALAGDDKAIERIFAMTGEWDPSAKTVEDARAVVMSVIESVVMHVKDPEVRKAILSDTQAAVTSFSVLNTHAIER